MVGRRARRDALELLAVEAAEGSDEARILDRLVDFAPTVDHCFPPGDQQRRLRLPGPAADVHLARLEVEVSAGTALAMIGRRVTRDPGKAGAQVRLVGRFV